MRAGVVILLALCTGMWSCDEEVESSAHQTLEQYLEKNNLTSADYNETASGLIYIINEEGSGSLATRGQTLTVHYTGTFTDGSKFDSSYDRGVAFSFILGTGRVIEGWDEGLTFFKEGSKGVLYIPYELGYGENGGGSIRPKEDLIFEINLISID